MKVSKKIALIGTTAASLYGFRADLIKRLVREGHTVYAFTSEYALEELEKVKLLGAEPITYNLSRGGLNPFEDIQSMFQLTKKLKQLQPYIVFSYFAKPVIYGTLAGKLANVPMKIGMLEGLGYTFTEQPEGVSKKTEIVKNIQVWLYKMSLPFLDKIILLNQDDQEDLLVKNNISVKKVEILGGIGLDLEYYAYEPRVGACPLNFLFIGRLLKEKGIHELIAAIKIVKDKYPETVFTILGSIDHANMGALKQSELDRYIETGLINYVGYVSNVKDYIIKSDVFVLPSYREGVPRSTQEAMAIGRPVITTDVPGCRETVIDGVNGFLVPKWNVEVLAEKMIYFIENPQQIAIMGDESHKIATQRFDVNKVNQALLEILELY